MLNEACSSGCGSLLKHLQARCCSECGGFEEALLAEKPVDLGSHMFLLTHVSRRRRKEHL